MRTTLAVCMLAIWATGAMAEPGMYAPPKREIHAAQPSPAFVAQLESSLRMPEGAWPIRRYVRYYTLSSNAGHRTVRGSFVAPSIAGQTAGVHIVTNASMPDISDFGCKAGVLTYDLDLKRLTMIACNGM